METQEPFAKTLPAVHPGDAEVDIEVLKVVPCAFEIADESSANWLVKRIAAARAYGERVKLWAEQERRRAEREEQCLMTLFGRQLERWAKAEIEKLNGRRKSLSLPGGIVGFRAVAARLQVDDELAVIEWARAHCPTAIVVSERLSKTELNSHFEKNGDLPDAGAHVEPGGDRFFIR